MKKTLQLSLCLILTVALVTGLAACGGKGNKETKEYTYEIAFITPSAEASIDDGAYIENTWDGIRKFAEEEGKTYRYYEPSEPSAEGREAAVKAAKDAGAKIIVGYGDSMEEDFSRISEKYSDLTFLLVDPAGKMDSSGVDTINIDDVQAGYLAGYAAVTEGFETIGYIAAEDTPAARDYGYGFVQGCNQAAVQWGHFVDMRCTYKGYRAEEAAKEYFAAGTEVIAVYGSEDLLSTVTAQAEKLNRTVFSSFPYTLDETVTAAVNKDCAKAVYELLKDSTSGAAKDNKSYGVAEGYIGLTWNEEEFSLFIQEDYDRLLKQMKGKNFKLLDNSSAKTTQKMIEKGKLYKISLL